MTDQTPNLVLPYIAAAQSQKHVTHNEAIRMLDAIVQVGVASRTLTAPPAAPTDGDRYIVPTGAMGAWAGAPAKIAAWQDGAWAFYMPRTGWLAWVAAEARLYVFNGTAWAAYASGISSVNPIALVGVNATADATNRLAVTSPATLLNHDGAGHQLKINKAATAQTASLLFQNGFSGRAEYGLTGDDNFHVKVSPNGTSWQEAMVVDSASAMTSVRALDSIQFTMVRDTARTITTPTPSGILMINEVHPTSSNAAIAGILCYDIGTTPALASLGLSSRIVNGGVGAFTGRTGTAGNVTLSVGVGVLNIENRSGGANPAQFCITFINGFRSLT
ncbi:MAG: DUF2793 domain-containing protein [Hyphomicrobium aestuarii]|nr:DUF2793 domain-containing protein [Hyphomicrobium aestuarii]